MMGGRAPSGGSNDGLKAFKDVVNGYKQVQGQDGSFYGLWLNEKNNQLVAELPRGWERQNHFFAMTVSGGEVFAGLQASDMYTQWRKINDRMALVMPQIEVRSTGDQESKDSIATVFTDRVLVDVPLVSTGPNGQPVISLSELLVNNMQSFFGGSARGLNRSLTTVKEVKVFPQNIEIELEGPVAGGAMKSFHYSISLIQGTPGYKPREADPRVGYFTTAYRDLGKFTREETNNRYINRWNLEKAAPNLKLSPPKQPIVYYVEHTVPIRYRRWVREGIEQWNDAFRAIGIDGAIEVRYQDKASGAHMEKQPEDVRYNFIRWISNDVATAIGPSRVNPMTGEILDADVVLTDGWIRVFTYRWDDLLGNLAIEGMSPQTLSWLDRNPNWDPRLRLASPERREEMMIERQQRGLMRFGGHPIATADVEGAGENEYAGLMRMSQISGMCNLAQGKALDLAMMQMYLAAIDTFASIESAAEKSAEPEIDEETLEMVRKQLEENPGLRAMVPPEYLALLDGKKADEKDEPEAEPKENGEKPKDKPKQDPGDLIDGVPEWFVGPMLAELVAHAGPASQLQGLERVRHRRDQHRGLQGPEGLVDLRDGLQRREHPHAGLRRDPGRLLGDRHRAVRLLGDRVRLREQPEEGARARGRAGATVRDGRGHLRPRPDGPALRHGQGPAGLRQQPDGVRQPRAQGSADRLRQGGRLLGERAARVPDHAGHADADAVDDGQLGRLGVRVPRQEGRPERARPDRSGPG
jgi:hypothetical protein